jgi:hypothetical protein
MTIRPLIGDPGMRKRVEDAKRIRSVPERSWGHPRVGTRGHASAMLAAVMAMRLRKTLRSSSDFPWHHESSRHSLNGFCCAHDHAGR